MSMSTAGHFITMVGVIAFYIMILDSKLEKKTTTYLHSLVARFNKRVNYSVGKLIKNILNNNSIRYYFSKNVYGIINKI